MEKLIKRQEPKKESKTFLEIKTTLAESLKNHQRDSNGRYEHSKEKICKLENRTLEIVKSEEQKKRD